mmetsp:Transcript_70681/g.136416  ORF Transcript_70681/g.136416 Transcript_70681/m.136416 type:complete len:173 (+) Transcript_70681:155-673(+)
MYATPGLRLHRVTSSLNVLYHSSYACGLLLQRVTWPFLFKIFQDIFSDRTSVFMVTNFKTFDLSTFLLFVVVVVVVEVLVLVVVVVVVDVEVLVVVVDEVLVEVLVVEVVEVVVDVEVVVVVVVAVEVLVVVIVVVMVVDVVVVVFGWQNGRQVMLRQAVQCPPCPVNSSSV